MQKNMMEQLDLTASWDDCYGFLKSIKGRCVPQTKQEWSEEDANKILHALHNTYAADTANMLYCKIKSLRPQKKQEWSKEDIDMIDWLIRCCEKEHEELCNDRYGHQEIVSDLKRDCRKKWDWLESLKGKVVPQKQWKPSEEQMECLKEAADNYPNPDVTDALYEIYRQLKAL